MRAITPRAFDFENFIFNGYAGAEISSPAPATN